MSRPTPGPAEPDPKVEYATATVLQPGDHVLLTVASPDVNQFEGTVRELQRRFPGIAFTMVAGVTGVVVQPHSPDG